MRQILYASRSSVAGNGADLTAILEQSRHNNALDGISGLLWSDGARFIQVIEGPEDSVALAWDRIRQDVRHHSITVLHDELITARQFGTWNMVHRRADEVPDHHSARVRRIVARATPEISKQFLTLIAD